MSAGGTLSPTAALALELQQQLSSLDAEQRRIALLWLLAQEVVTAPPAARVTTAAVLFCGLHHTIAGALTSWLQHTPPAGQA